MIIPNIPENTSGEFSIHVHPHGGVYTYFGNIKKQSNRKTIFLYQGNTSWMSSTPMEYLHMCRAAQWCKDNPNATVAMNYPGIGNGKLSYNVIEPLLAILPEQVSVHVRR